MSESMKAEITMLWDYDRWATELQLEAVRKLTGEEYARDLDSSLGGVGGTMVHIYAAEYIWSSRWMGSSPDSLPTVAQIPRLDGLIERWDRLRVDIHRYLEALTEERLTAPFEYSNTRGETFNEPLVLQIRHVINHSSYHRGQITTMLRQLGKTPPASVDLMTFLRL